MISVDDYPFFGFLRPDLSPRGNRNRCFLVAPDSKETKLGSSNQEHFPSAGKNTGVVLVPCCTWKCIPAALVVWIFLRPLGVIC